MQPVIQRVAAAVDLLGLHARDPQQFPFLLESVAAGTDQGRFDILFAYPQQALHCVEPNAKGAAFLHQLDCQWRRAGPLEARSRYPFSGGWFVYLAYELAAQIEPRLCLPRAANTGPIALAVRCPAALVRDHERDEVVAVVEPEYAALLPELLRDAATAKPWQPSLIRVGPIQEEPAEKYLSALARIQQYIIEGDVFQVNLSRAWQLHSEGSAAAHYHALRRTNPAPFAGLAQWGDSAVICSSPERLVRVRDGMIETRPIAGTRGRSVIGAEDRALARQLIAHPKERAEHIMLIDLERNDLGRVCEPGTVEVNELMQVESYAHVHHIVSNVRGRLRAGTTPGEQIAAVFPGGTITGCPKLRCMEIVAELEQTGRGPYTGAMGYLNRDGSMDLNILIRCLHQVGDELLLRAGAGIVADSDPHHELAETRSKAQGILLAFQ